MKLLHLTSARLIAILLLAFALRVFLLEARPLWYDDAFSVFLAERGLAAIAAGTAVDTMPPGYYALLWGWMNGLGQSPFAMRMLSVAMSMLIVTMVFVIAKRGFGAGAGTWAAFLAALLPFQIYHAQELRMYTLLALGGLVYLYGVLLLRDSKGASAWRALGLIALGTMLALYAHNLAFVTLLAGNVYLLFKRAWRQQAWLLGGQLIGALAFLPWLFYVPAQLEKIQRAFWTQPPGLLDWVQMMLVFTTYLPLPPPLIGLALLVTILVLVFATWQLVKLARRKKLPALGLLITFALFPPILLFILSYLIRPVFVPRGAIVSSLAYVILLAVVAARAPRRLQIGLAGLTVILALTFLSFYYSVFGEWRRAPYAQADAFLRAQFQNGDLIVHDNKLSFFPMHYYDRALPQVFLADPPNSDNDTFAPGSQQAMQLFPTSWETAIGSSPRVWFVIYQTAIDEARAANVPHANLARLESTMQRAQENEYGDVRIFLYTTR